MNTPAHAVVNLWLLGSEERPGEVWPLAAGAVLPDLPMVVFYAWEKLRGTAEAVIWGERYYEAGWQAFFDLFNSIPILLVVMALARWVGRRGLFLLAASMTLHGFFDLPLHREDAHRHFWPLSDFRFESPISYWDPDHFGGWFALAEIALVLAGSVVLWRRFPRPGVRLLVTLVAALYLGYWGYVAVVWM